jgi:hypothetical protein
MEINSIASRRTGEQIRLCYLSKLGFRPQSESVCERQRSHQGTKKIIGSLRPRVHFDDRVSIIEPTSWASQDQQCPNSVSELWYTLEELREAAERNAWDPITTDHHGDELSVSSHGTYSSSIPENSLDIKELCQVNLPLAIRNACLRPPGRQERTNMLWLQQV